MDFDDKTCIKVGYSKQVVEALGIPIDSFNSKEIPTKEIKVEVPVENKEDKALIDSLKKELEETKKEKLHIENKFRKQSKEYFNYKYNIDTIPFLRGLILLIKRRRY